MTPCRAHRFPRVFSVLAFLLFASLSQTQPAAVPMTPQPPAAAQPCSSPSPPTYIGAYLSDGNFHAGTRAARWTWQGLGSSDSGLGFGMQLRPRDVPGYVDLHPRERVIENYDPPAYAKKVVKKRFFLSWLRDDVIMLVYGRERILLAPEHLTSDSQGRIIVSDPGLGAVHVLDGNKSFRIVAGPDRRLHQPRGIAVDAENNIYVADSDRGVVVMFDSSGNFLRELGKMENETLFHSPTGLAIDHRNGHLYLLDTPRDVLFILDLQGNVLKRVGKGRGHAIGRHAGDALPLDLRQPSEIALSNDKLVVLDSMGSRIQVMDLQGQLLNQFSIAVLNGSETTAKTGLGLDSVGHIYVSNSRASNVQVFDESGRLLSSLGRPGYNAGEFNAPSSLWIDSQDRLYIADTNNHRLQVFHLNEPCSAAMSATETR